MEGEHTREAPRPCAVAVQALALSLPFDIYRCRRTQARCVR